MCQLVMLVELIIIRNGCKIPSQTVSAVNIQTVSAVNKMMRLAFMICLMFDCLRRENNLEIPKYHNCLNLKMNQNISELMVIGKK